MFTGKMQGPSAASRLFWHPCLMCFRTLVRVSCNAMSRTYLYKRWFQIMKFLVSSTPIPWSREADCPLRQSGTGTRNLGRPILMYPVEKIVFTLGFAPFSKVWRKFLCGL